MTWTLQTPTRALSLGEDLTGVGLVAYPTVKTNSNIDSYANPRNDGTRFGKLTRANQTVSLPVEVRADDRALDEVWRELITVWRADDVRQERGALAALIADSGRRAFGIPVNLEPDLQYRLFGVARATLEFDCVDDLWYGDETWTDVLFAPPVSGGLTFPAVAPFTFDSGPSQRNASVQVDGDVATWPVFEIAGPVTNPEIAIVGGSRLVFATSLAYDQVLVVDTRPWSRHVKRDGADFPGALSPVGDRLSDMSLKPGAHQVVLKGYDPTGSSKLRVRVAPAYTSF